MDHNLSNHIRVVGACSGFREKLCHDVSWRLAQKGRGGGGLPDRSGIRCSCAVLVVRRLQTQSPAEPDPGRLCVV